MTFNQIPSEQAVIRVDIFTPNDENISKEDKDKITRLFFRFVLNVAMLLFSFYMTITSMDIFFLICTLFLFYLSFTSGKAYYVSAAGRGIKTSYIFSLSGLTVVGFMSVTEIPYTIISRVLQRDDGLVIEVKGGVMHFLPNDALNEYNARNRLCSFLRKRMPEKYKVIVKSRKQVEEEEKLAVLEKQERINKLGKQITTISYTVTGADMRIYHRIVLRRMKKLRHILLSVIGAVATVLPIINGITGEAIWFSLFCIFLLILALIFIIPKIGFTAPAKMCFFAGKNEKIDCYIHENGIALKSGNRRVLERWEGMEEVVFDETDGIYANMGVNCTVLLPTDLLIGPIYSLINENYNRAMKQTEEE